MTKTDCFAYNTKRHECMARDKTYCANGAEECSFYKTREEAEEERYKSFRRRMLLNMKPTKEDYADGFVGRT